MVETSVQDVERILVNVKIIVLYAEKSLAFVQTSVLFVVKTHVYVSLIL